MIIIVHTRSYTYYNVYMNIVFMIIWQRLWTVTLTDWCWHASFYFTGYPVATVCLTDHDIAYCTYGIIFGCILAGTASAIGI